MNKRFLGLFLLFFLLIILSTTGCNSNSADILDDFDTPFVNDGVVLASSEAVPIGDDMPISRALVAKMIALAFATQTEIDQAARYIDFADTSPEMWFDRYINKSYILGYLSGTDGHFYPNDPLTLAQAQIILDRLDDDNPIRINLTDENSNLAISYALWVNLFTQMLDNIGGASARGLRTINAVVLATPNFNQNLPADNIITDKGHFSTRGLGFEPYLNKQISLLVRGNEVLAVLGVVNETPTLHNVFIIGTNIDGSPQAGFITIFAGGVGRTFIADPGIINNLPIGNIADVSISGQRITAVNVMNTTIGGVVKEVGTNHIEIEGVGRVATHPDFTIFSLTSDNISAGRPSQITIGYDVAEFVLRDDGQIASAIILRRPMPSHIRVLITTTGFASRVHASVQMRSAGGLVIHSPDGITELAPNEIFNLSYQNSYLLGGGRITIESLNDAKIEIMNISRNWGGSVHPQYRGLMEISGRDGGFIIVNQLPLEEYLYAVIPSEMPTSFGLTPAKVQAITARSYAYNQFFANRFHAYGANVDDSVTTQVYNNIPETSLAIDAVAATRSLFLTHNGNVVSANYFSTSSGHTADRGDVWINGATGQLDATTPPYLRGMPQMAGADFGDLSIEANAAVFFKDTNITAYDSNSPWFRWNFSVTTEQISRIISNNAPHLALEIGDFRGMEIVARGRGGNVTELAIHGTLGTTNILTELAIRQLLVPSLPEGILMNRHAGATPVNNHFILPSTFMVFEQNGNNWVFYGGGFGHGVGMSQHGAHGMSQRGYDYRQILAHFYPEAQVLSLTPQ
ncbi:MAG: SpoIID/LytB domain-containing protein [Defluviitaleaceae bacterium]|nr:SpoIID/LytB domain-containing protein [Defluviitaleaceae bacterium]